MINIVIKDSVMCNGNYSLFVSFDYNTDILDIVKSFPTRNYNKNDKTWELPFNQLGNLVNKLSDYDITISGKYIKLETGEKEIPTSFKFKTKPFKHQIEGVKYGINHDKWLLGDEQGLGKALALNTKVFTPNGYKQMKDIQVGDYVFGKDGKPTKVTAVYNHSNVEMYRITFSDGVSIECCKDHLWQIHDQHGIKVVDTKWFTEKDQFGRVRKNNLFSEGSGSYKYWIDRCEPVQFEHQNVTVNPYVLGALLGDGGLTSNSISFTTADKEMVDNINANLRVGYRLNSSQSMSDIEYNIVGIKGKVNEIKKDLIELNLWNTNSHTKFIPDLYKYNSIAIRTQVLQGLIDTDGYVSKDNLLSYTTVSKQLCEDVRFLVESLGGIVRYSESSCGYNGKVTGKCYTLTIKFDKPQLYCTLTRKKSLLKDRHFKTRRNIVSVEPIKNADAKCITVDNNEHLYLIDHFVVTHNTKQVIDLACVKNVKHCLIICCVNGLKWNWQNEVHTHSNEGAWILGQRKNKNDKLVIGSNADRLDDLMNINDLPKFIITNIETLRYKVKTGRKIMVKVKGKLKEVDEYRYPITERLQELCASGDIEMIAADEVHKCKNPEADQTEQLLKLHTKYQIAMTGTPLMNAPIDLYALLNWLGYEKHTFWQFKTHYGRLGGFNGTQVVGYKNLEEIEETLDTMMLRRLKEDRLDLPEKTLINEYVEMGKEQSRIYDMAHSDIISNLANLKMANNPLAELIRLRQATGNPNILTPDVTDNAKFDRMEELVDDAVENGRKVVIFSNWTQITNPAFKRLSKKYRGVMITGDTKDNERQSNVEAFQNDDRVKFIIGTIGAMGTGLTMTAGSVEIFLDEPWNMALKEQAIDRCHRIGQNSNITVYTLLCKDTIDERINSLVEKKGQMSEILIDGKIQGDKNALINYLLS